MLLLFYSHYLVQLTYNSRLYIKKKRLNCCIREVAGDLESAVITDVDVV